MLAPPLFIDEPAIESAPQSTATATAQPANPWWTRGALATIMLVSIVLNFYQLGQTGFGNLYYAAGVRSMLDNLHNFFFVSFDPGGFVTLDKPPLGFWLQVISAKIFGFTAFSVFLPQALAGVISVWLLFVLVRRHFGDVAGLIAALALALALSPISVATNRNNTIDSTLALTMLIAAWAVMRAAETGQFRWLILTGVLIGLGFNIKMLEAYLVVPAFGLVYLLGAPGTWRTRILHLFAAVGSMIAVSLAWVVTVDLIPASLRPYVGSSQNNSELSLALGYNGITRLLGNVFQGGGNRGAPGGAFNGQPPQGGFAGGPPAGVDLRGGAPFAGGPPNGAGQASGGGLFNTGNPGIFRLFIQPLAGQVAWLLPLALGGLVGLAAEWRWRARTERQNLSLILWGGWLVTMGVFFSVAGFFHEYYLTMIAPAIAALVGIGIVVLWRQFRASGWLGWLLPVSIALTTIEQLTLLSSYTQWAWLIPFVGVLGIGAAVTLAALRFTSASRTFARRIIGIVAAGMLAVFIVPVIWSTGSMLNGAQMLPTANPPATTSTSANGPRDNATADSTLIAYLLAHRGTATYLVATQSSQTADSIILATNQPVMALGGFSGSDPILTATSVAALVKNGTVRYFLLGGGGGPGGNPTGSSSAGTGQSATSWVTQNCTAVTVSGQQLYDCGG